MFLLNYLRKFKWIIKHKIKIIVEYCFDCKDYLKFNYNRHGLHSKNALEAKILRQAHVIEKGMSLSHPRYGFGLDKAKTLLNYIREFELHGYKINDSVAVKNSLKVVGAYIDFQLKRDFNPSEVIAEYNKLSENENTERYGIVKTTLEAQQKEANSNFEIFFKSRHSVRQFKDIPIKIEDLKKAVNLAMYCPSACNRQSCKVYFYHDKNINEKLSELIAGNTGFEKEAANYLVVTSDISAFYDDFERNQMYVDGGIFALALAEALHYYGIANCILQNGEFHKKNKKFHEICRNIPENEKIILFIAIGYYKDEYSYASSHRKILDDVLKIQ